MSSDFKFFLNRQGVRGNKGEQGEQGYSPRITVKTETASEYVLNVQNEDGSYDTPNLRGNAIENLGGTYVRFNQDTEQMYTGYADTASTTSQGEVTLSTYEDLASGGDESEVTTSKDVHDFVEAKISEASVNYVDIDDYTQKMSELDGEISDLDNNKLDFTGLANTLAAGTNITITPNTSTGKITIAGEPVSQAQADWNQTDTDAPDYIKNKPVIDDELSSTSTNAVQNRLVTNAINLISNEFENYATNKLDNLSNEGEARLHALKAYSDNGELLTDAEGLADVITYAHSTFDNSKFTIVGSPNITDDGVASGFSSSNYITVPTLPTSGNYTIKGEFTTPATLDNTIPLGIGTLVESTTKLLFSLRYNSNNRIRLLVRNTNGTNTELPTSYQASTNTSYNYEIRVNGASVSFYINDSLVGSIDNFCELLPAIIVIGIDRNLSSAFTGSIDLKQFSITVDGVEVFSGNKTGIDTIKPDDYTVVGSPTISADGIASGFSSSNYLTTSTISSATKSYEEFICFNINEYPSNTRIIRGTTTGQVKGLCLTLGGSGKTKEYLEIAINTENSSTWDYNYTSNYVCALNTNYYVKIIWNGQVYKGLVSTNTQDWTEFASFNSVNPIASSNVSLGSGLSKWNSTNRYFTGSIDLNSFKIYVDGNLVYQPCLKIPYTKSKTGSKIVNAIYRGRVNDMASQFGYASYYTLDEDNGNFTLPQVELYGLIEKAASTVPSGVVQSSTINNIVSLTQAEYDALVTKDSNTFYVITPST